MVENGILKRGWAADFQAHQITNFSHGQGLAVIHPALYRVMCQKAPEKFARFAVNVRGISDEGKAERKLSMAGVEAPADFIVKCGLPVRLRDLLMKDEPQKLLTASMLREIPDSCNLLQTGQAGVSHDEILEILKKCIDLSHTKHPQGFHPAGARIHHIQTVSRLPHSALIRQSSMQKLIYTLYFAKFGPLPATAAARYGISRLALPFGSNIFFLDWQHRPPVVC